MNKEVRTKPKKIQSFKDLVVWQKGHSLVLFVYEITKGFPQEEIFGLSNQMRRSAVSITSNIAEGFSRNSYKEKIQFYAVALGSLTELQNQLFIAKDVGYMSDGSFQEAANLTEEIHKMINGLLKSSKKFLDGPTP